jgi:hypothetical protein
MSAAACSSNDFNPSRTSLWSSAMITLIILLIVLAHE